jgi:hypothetical protein
MIMTFYDFTVTQNNQQRLHIKGMGVLSIALEYLEGAAEDGRLGPDVNVAMWKDISVPGLVLQGLLEKLNEDCAWVEPESTYTVSLDEF